MSSSANLVYAAVCRGHTVLCAFQHPSAPAYIERLVTDYLCTFSVEHDTKTTFNNSGYVFHLVVASGLVYICGATASVGVRQPFNFLNTIQERFQSGGFPSRAYNAGEHDFNREFSSVLRDVMESYNSGDVESGDLVDKTRKQVKDVQQVMQQNIERIVERGENLRDISERTDVLVNSAVEFRVQARRVERKMWWKNLKMWVILAIVGTIILTLIILWANGTI